MCKIYAIFKTNFARLVLNELNLCKIYAIFNAKYARSTINSTQIVQDLR